MLDFDIGKTFGAMVKTMPFLLLRILVYAGIAIGYVIATGVGAGLGAAFGLLGGAFGGGAFWGGMVGFGLVSAILYWAREYLLYLVKAGHIAVLVQLYDGQDFPAGRGQIDHAQSVVRKRFVETSVLFGVDRLIKVILRAINRALFTVARFVPVPGLRSLVGLANQVINLSLTYTDELILAYNIRVGSSNPWESSKDALILYAQNYKVMVKNALVLMLIMWSLTFLVFVVFLTPAAAMAALLPGPVDVVGFVVALVAAVAMKAALLEPFAVAALMQVYFKAIDGQQPDPAWDERLSGASRQFQQLKTKAASWGRGGATGEPSRAPAG